MPEIAAPATAIPRRRAVRFDLAWFLIGTFAWAWLLWGYWVVAMPTGGLQISPAFIACAIIGGLAPSLAALAVSWFAGGRRALRELLASLAKWRVHFGIIALVLLLAPAATFVSVGLQSMLIGPLRWPDPSLLAMALVWPVLAALGEELGWRGFLLPRLETRLNLLPAALLIGALWGLWHLPADFIALKGYGGLFWLAFLINGPIVLTAHSVIMAWIWRATGGSTFAVVLYHASITASAIVAPSAGSEGWPGILAAAIGAAIVCVAAIVLVIVRRDDFEPARGERL
jgi:membrane protease YdiL (CAAX protease family)